MILDIILLKNTTVYKISTVLFTITILWIEKLVKIL